MDSYRLRVSRDVLRLIRNTQDGEQAEQLTRVFLNLASHPTPASAVSVPDAPLFYCLTAGQFEIQYTINHEERLIHVHAVVRRAPDA